MQATIAAACRGPHPNPEGEGAKPERCFSLSLWGRGESATAAVSQPGRLRAHAGCNAPARSKR